MRDYHEKGCEGYTDCHCASNEIARLRASLAASEAKLAEAEVRATEAEEHAVVLRSGMTVLEVTLAEARDVLRSVEWKGVHSWGYEESGCPMCGATTLPEDQKSHHAPGCRLAALLENKGVDRG